MAAGGFDVALSSSRLYILQEPAARENHHRHCRSLGRDTELQISTFVHLTLSTLFFTLFFLERSSTQHIKVQRSRFGYKGFFFFFVALARSIFYVPPPGVTRTLHPSPFIRT